MCVNPPHLYEVNKDYLKAIHGKSTIFFNDKLNNIVFPCGGCLECRVDSLALWSARCNYEYYNKPSAFVTFTYNKYFINWNESHNYMTLCRDDFSKLIERIQKKVNPFYNFSYFGNGEYGGMFNRPHLHILFFGLDFQKNKKVFLDSWKFGHVEVLPLYTGGINYVVDYFTKDKVTGDMAIKEFDNKGIERPFITCSKGFGAELFYNHREEIRNGQPLKLGSRLIPVPSYYKNLYCQFDDNEIYNRYSQFVENARNLKLIAKKNGFDDVDVYLKKCRIAKEKSLETQFRNKGIPFNSKLSFYKKCDTKLLSNLALQD